jgi:hypothetical protein
MGSRKDSWSDVKNPPKVKDPVAMGKANEKRATKMVQKRRQFRDAESGTSSFKSKSNSRSSLLGGL